MELPDHEAANLANHGRRKTTIPIRLKSSSSPKPSRAKSRSSKSSRSKKNLDLSITTKTTLDADMINEDIEHINIPSITPASDEPLHKNKRLRWDHPVKDIGSKVSGEHLFCCELCELPIAVYGRMIPCRHIFCLDCANKSYKVEEKCPRCGVGIKFIQQTALGALFICTYGAPKHSHKGCDRGYLSLRDMHAHIDFRHVPKAKNASTNKSSTQMISNPATSSADISSRSKSQTASMSTTRIQAAPLQVTSEQKSQHSAISPHMTLSNQSPMPVQILQPVQQPIQAQKPIVSNTQMIMTPTLQQPVQQTHLLPNARSLPTIIQPQSIAQPTPSIQQPINMQQSINTLNQPPPINMIQPTGQSNAMPIANNIQTPQPLPQPTPPSQVARIALANQQNINRPLLIPPQHSGAAVPPPRGGNMPIRPGDSNTRMMNSVAPMESYHASNSTTQVSNNYRSQPPQAFPVNQHQMTGNRYSAPNISASNNPVQQQPPPPHQPSMALNRMMYNNQSTMGYGNVQSINPADQNTPIMGGNQPMGQPRPFQGNQQRFGGPQGPNPQGQGMWNCPPRRLPPPRGGPGPMRHPRPNMGGHPQRPYY